MKTFYVRPNSTQNSYLLQTAEGETQTVKFDWSAKASAESTSVSSAVWTVESGQATVASATLASGIVSAKVATASAGHSVIKVAATMADGQVDIVQLDVICKPLTSITASCIQ